MAFTVDTTTDIGKVRLLLSDLDQTKPIYPDDAQIQAFLDMEQGSVRLAAALALEAIAANRVLTLQVIQLLDLKLDGASVAKAFLQAAKQWRDAANDDWAGLDFAQTVDNSDFAWREHYLKLVVSQYAGSSGAI
jgi:hypothetical protein